MFSTLDKITLAFVALACLVLVAGMAATLYQRHCTDKHLRKIKPLRHIGARRCPSGSGRWRHGA